VPESRQRRGAPGLLLCATLVACGGGGTPGPTPPDTSAALSAEAALGEKIFNDGALSASGRMACASCHVEAAGHAQDNALAAQLGGPALDRQGSRTAPSIRYLAFAPAFRLDSRGAPSGGLFWDGRASTLAEQAGRPFFNAAEMALPDAAALATRLAAAPYAAEFRALYGADVFTRPDEALARTTQALQRYQREDRDFAPFSSKFDAVQRGQATYGAAEQRGLALFTDPAKGNCAFCHTPVAEAGQPGALFTNFSYHVLGVPRNAELLANADPAHFDLGLCAREGGDLAARTDLCGAFRTPSLRNVALRRALFHNGRFKTLHDALAFYVQRDTHPERFYPVAADGSVARFDDLPPQLHANVDRRNGPYDRGSVGTPALDAAEIDDLVAFLRTLDDGFRP
jgi:cytochrome c peroxidase